MVREGAVLETLLTATLVVVVGAFLVGQLLGQPVLLGFVTTGSMAPTMEPGDGFVVVPDALAGDISAGDIVVFQAERLHDGGLTTHRVVRETDEGYITKGDANPFTDQDGDEPPVDRAQVVGVVPTVLGTPLVIPHLGTPILVATDLVDRIDGGGLIQLSVRNFAYLLFALGLGLYAISLLWEGDRRSRERPAREQNERIFNATHVALLFAAFIVLVATAGMAVASGTHSFDVISSESDSVDPSVILAGSNETVTYTLTNRGLVPVSVFTETSNGATLEPDAFRIERGDHVNATLQLNAPEQPGYYQRFVTEYWYPGILPHGTLRTLYSVHPWLPVAIIDVLIGIGAGGIAVVIVGHGRYRIRERDDRSLFDADWLRP